MFSVVYLNEISVEGLDANAGAGGCIGKFQAKGGWPEFDNSKKYTITITKQGNPSVVGQILAPPANQLGHDANVFFSVPETGTYIINIEDGKSCGHTFTMAMNACDPTDNVVITVSNINAAPGTNICVPLTVENMAGLASFSFNLAWDPTVLQYTNVNKIHPALLDFDPSLNIGDFFIGQGALNILYFTTTNPTFTIPDNEVLLEVCFDVLGNVGDCETINTSNFPAPMDMSLPLPPPNNQVGLTFIPGDLCIGVNPLAVAVVAHDTCNAAGSITITCSGGNEPYDLTIQGPTPGSGAINTSGGSFTVLNLAAGDYTITVVDGAGVIETIPAKVTVTSLGSSMAFIQPQCNGGCDGAISATITIDGVNVGTFGPEYQFQWSANVTGNPQTNAIINLCSDTNPYSVTVTNTALGCSTFAAGTLGQPSLVTPAGTQIKAASCTGIGNGSILLNVQGGTPKFGGDYDFEWGYSTSATGPFTPNPSWTQTANPANLQNLQAGHYQATISDANGCSATHTIEVTAAKILTLDLVNSASVSCFGDSDGVLNVQVNLTPNQLDQIAVWTVVPPNGAQIPGATSLQVNNLPAGSYTITAVDTAGCSAMNTFNVGEPQQIQVNVANAINPTCPNPNGGSIALGFPIGGVPPFNYLWSNGSPAQNISNLPAGLYEVTVTDDNNCTSTQSVTLTLPPSPEITGIDSVSVSCGSDGCLEVLVSGSNLTFSWKNLTTGTVVGSNNAEICGLNGGEYEVSVTDIQGCQTIDTLILDGKNALAITAFEVKNPDCAGGTDGIVQPTISGGTPTYIFNWSNGVTSQVLFGVGAGNYTLVVTDGNQCTVSQTFEVENPPVISPTFVIDPNGTSCASECDGQARVEVEYSDGSSGNFNFRWEDNLTLNDSIRNNLCPGTTTVTITDFNDCTVVDSVFISSPPAVVADTFYTIPARCDGDDNGSAFVSGGGGSGSGYTYDWGGAFPFTNFLNGILDSGQYVVTITDGAGCTGTQILVVSDPDPMQILKDNAVSNDILCNGGDNGQIGITVLGGNPGVLAYLWTNGTDTIGNTALVDGLAAGRYYVTVTDPEGCTATTEPFVLIDPPPVNGAYLPWEELLCFGDQTTLFIDTIYGGSGGPYQYSLDYGVTLDEDFPITMSGGPHVITYFDRLGCGHEDSISVVEPPLIEVTFNLGVDEVELGDSILLIPNITGAAVDSFIWAPADRLSDPFSLKTYTKTFESTTYTLSVWDAKGCSGEGTVRVKIDPNRNVFIPNIFHPGNTSGFNDRFNVNVGNGVEKVNFMKIFDRWGNQLYTRENFFPNNNDFSEGWDGTYRGDRMNPGVYVYIIEVKFLDNQVLLYRGDVTLYR